MRLILAAALALAASVAEAQVKIGLSAPLTGPDAAFGQGMRAAAEQAVADLNRGGGANGQRLVLVVADDAGEGKQSVAVARKFAAERVTLVVGPLGSAAAALAFPVYEEAGIVAVTPGATWAPLTGRGLWNVFRTCGSDAEQGTIAGRHLADRYRDRRIALVHDKSAFGRGLADGVARVLKAAGTPEIAFEPLDRGERDYAALAAKLRQARIEIVYFGGFAPEAGLLVRAMREAGLDAPLVGSDGLLDKEFPRIAGSGAEGTAMTLAPEPRRLPEPKGAPARAPRPPEAEAFAAQTYAAVEVLARGVAGARSAEGRKVAAFLRGGAPVATAIGEVAYDANGDMLRSGYALHVWKRTPDGRIDYAGNLLPP
ncbi:branched-chain amino acid ABC transporter substrate-binding protein [Methylobacterium iners]|uniref:Leu/Ile/Val-binding protein n=1 Tax=Methylobacterium iners TaxID=418707 RepID=A0ABQ4RY13_9HYPH|nr:branched-chain amino acid ABC transporter substrate-binding protein [Methylobacterium iners]GJD95077.1 Leu/Ile/Val-binding protein [Methylobacterium iners]